MENCFYFFFHFKITSLEYMIIMSTWLISVENMCIHTICGMLFCLFCWWHRKHTQMIKHWVFTWDCFRLLDGGLRMIFSFPCFSEFSAINTKWLCDRLENYFCTVSKSYIIFLSKFHNFGFKNKHLEYLKPIDFLTFWCSSLESN